MRIPERFTVRTVSAACVKSSASGIETGSRVAVAREALRSGVRTTTPWRRASRTSVCGLQNPIGWALSSAAQNAAGSWYLIHDEAYTR